MRSKLFVPGSRPELFSKAMASAADAITFDLEDAVEASRKASARADVAEFLASLPARREKLTIVRINDLGTKHFEADIEAVLQPALDLLNVPKIETAQEVHRVMDLVEIIEARKGADGEEQPQSRVQLLVNIESPAGLRNVEQIAGGSSRLAGLQIGFGDLLAPLGMARDPAILAHTRIAVRLAGAEKGLPCYDSAFVNIADLEGFEADALSARRLGFTGKSCIHPSQVDTANRVFSPTPEEIKRAQRVIEASHEARSNGLGAFTVDGIMVDLPFIQSAQRTLAAAERLGLLSAR